MRGRPLHCREIRRAGRRRPSVPNAAAQDGAFAQLSHAPWASVPLKKLVMLVVKKGCNAEVLQWGRACWGACPAPGQWQAKECCCTAAEGGNGVPAAPSCDAQRPGLTSVGLPASPSFHATKQLDSWGTQIWPPGACSRARKNLVGYGVQRRCGLVQRALGALSSSGHAAAR